MLRGFLELFFLIVIDVRPLAFGEPVYEECLGSAPEKDDGTVAFRSSLPRPGNPLFDDLTAKVASIWPFSARATASRKTASGISGKALKPLGFEDSQCWAQFNL